jgi:hypothetical protein
MLVSVSPLEKADAQILLARVGFVPTRDTGGFKVGRNIRPVSVIDPRRDLGSYRTIGDIRLSTRYRGNRPVTDAGFSDYRTIFGSN